MLKYDKSLIPDGTTLDIRKEDAILKPMIQMIITYHLLSHQKLDKMLTLKVKIFVPRKKR